MEIRKIVISNFRGIKHLDWVIPSGKNKTCLIGPGDTGKTTVLDAISFALCDKWNLSFSDSDFWMCDPETTIEIEVVVTNIIPILDFDTDMLLSGIGEDGELRRDPDDLLEACLIIRFTVNSSLEPVWEIRKEGTDECREFGLSKRRKLSAFRVDDRIDHVISLAKNAPAGRTIRSESEFGKMLTAFRRGGSEAIRELPTPETDEKIAELERSIAGFEAGRHPNLKIGSNHSTSISSPLSLYNEEVPISCEGTGSKRLFCIAVQCSSAESKPVLLIDEIETGLEPHRLVALFDALDSFDPKPQVFCTSHSPIAIEQLDTAQIAVMRNESGNAYIEYLDDDMVSIQRSTPSAFLAREILVCEGRTEYGVALELSKLWDAERRNESKISSVNRGVVIAEGAGDSQAILRAKSFFKAGYKVSLLLDNDNAEIEEQLEQVQTDGVYVVRCDVGHSVEAEFVCALNSAQAIDTFISQILSVATKPKECITSRLEASGVPAADFAENIGDWSYNKPDRLSKLSDAIKKAELLKNLSFAREHGKWIYKNLALFNNESHFIRDYLPMLKTALYGEEN
jgi:hypothetical protein